MNQAIRYSPRNKERILPDEMWLEIFSFLDIKDLGRLAMVNRRFHQLAYDEKLWEKLRQSGKMVPVLDITLGLRTFTSSRRIVFKYQFLS